MISKDWQIASFASEPLIEPTSGPTADPDGDGMANLHEYLFARDPLFPASPAIKPRFEFIDGVATLTHRHAHATEDAAVRLQASGDLIFLFSSRVTHAPGAGRFVAAANL